MPLVGYPDSADGSLEDVPAEQPPVSLLECGARLHGALHSDFSRSSHSPPAAPTPETDAGVSPMNIDFPEHERSPSPSAPALERRGEDKSKKRSNAHEADPPASALKRELPFRAAAKVSRVKIEGKGAIHPRRKRAHKTPSAVPSSEEDVEEGPLKKRTRTLVGGESVDDPIDVDQYASMWDPTPSSHYVSLITLGLLTVDSGGLDCFQGGCSSFCQ